MKDLALVAGCFAVDLTTGAALGCYLARRTTRRLAVTTLVESPEAGRVRRQLTAVCDEHDRSMAHWRNYRALPDDQREAARRACAAVTRARRTSQSVDSDQLALARIYSRTIR